MADRAYWENFYREDCFKGQPLHTVETRFARFVANDLPDDVPRSGRLLDVGCGNGRDSAYFARNGWDVLAVDQIDVGFLNDRYKPVPRLRFMSVDCGRLSDIDQTFDLIYARFILQSITEAEEDRFLSGAVDRLDERGRLCIECRTVHDPLFGVGEPGPDRNSFVTDHYRRFIDESALDAKLKTLGFSIQHRCLSRGLAPYGDEDPRILRLVAVPGA